MMENTQDEWDLIQKGYFGKQTKLRSTDPSMFQILTWNVEEEISPQKFNHRLNKQEFQNQNYQCRCHTSRIQGHNTDQVQNTFQENREIQKVKKDHDTKNDEKMPKKNNKNRAKSSRNSEMFSKMENYQSPRYQKKKIEIDQDQKEINQNQLIKKFKQTTRWIPNSSFTTYFGKPAFENYGRANTKPMSGGLLYGDYLRTHNIQPHRGINSPISRQTYTAALLKGKQLGEIFPFPPKMSTFEKQNFVQQPQPLQKSTIYPQKNKVPSFPIKSPNLYQIEKFGGKGMKKVLKSTLDRCLQQDKVEKEQIEKDNMDLLEKYKKRRQTQPKQMPYPEGKKIR